MHPDTDTTVADATSVAAVAASVTPTETVAPVAAVKAKSGKRAKYGFELNFPKAPFTIKNLIANKAKTKDGVISYITIFMRVRAALKAGTIVVTGKRKSQESGKRGRREIVYSRADAMTVVAEAPATTATV